MTISEIELRRELLDKALAGAKLPEAIEYAHDMWRFVSGQDAALTYGPDSMTGWMRGATPVPMDEVPRIVRAEVVGIALGPEGRWRRIDLDGDTLPMSAEAFDTHPIWGGMRDIVTDEGLHLVEIPKFWVRFEARGDERLWWVSPRAREGFDLHPAFLATDGRAVAVLRVAKYLATDKAGKVGVAAGETPWTSITIDEARRRCEALGQGWRMWSVYDQAAVQLLALIEMGTPDMQDAIARGNVDGGGVKPTGSTGAAWRGIHDLWGNVWQFVDGLRVTSGGVIEVWHDLLPGPDAWVNTGVAYGPGKDDGFPTDLHTEQDRGFNLSLLFLPSDVSDDREDAIIPDYTWGRWQDRETIALRGGYWGGGGDAGVFALDLAHARSVARTGIGCRPAFGF